MSTLIRRGEKKERRGKVLRISTLEKEGTRLGGKIEVEEAAKGGVELARRRAASLGVNSGEAGDEVRMTGLEQGKFTETLKKLALGEEENL